MPTGLIVANFFLYASMPFVGALLKDSVANTKGKKKMSSWGPKRGRKCYVTPAFSGVPNAKRGEKIRSSCHTPPSRGPKRGRKCYVTTAFSGVPKQRETKSELAASSLPTLGPKKGGNATSPLRSRGSPNKAGQNQKWQTHPYLLGGPKKGRNATSPLHSGGSETKGDTIRIDCLTPAYSGPKRGQNCYVTPAFSGIPNKGGHNQNWLPHPCLLRFFCCTHLPQKKIYTNYNIHPTNWGPPDMTATLCRRPPNGAQPLAGGCWTR